MSLELLRDESGLFRSPMSGLFPSKEFELDGLSGKEPGDGQLSRPPGVPTDDRGLE